ncbi:MAG: glycosyltransferase [Luminiphilus sp.]|nr:glycosyltransferase [Luminiphilus sp.]
MTDHNEQSSRVRVLHVGKYFPPDPGGMETYLRDLMMSSVSMGTRSAALVHRSRASIQSIEERYQSNEISVAITRVASWFRLLFTPISPTFPLALSRMIKRQRPSILHLHLPNPSTFWALLLPSARRLPWVIHWQSDVLTPKSSRLLRLCYPFYQPLESALLSHASQIITTSPQYLHSSKTLARYKQRCCVIPLGISDRFDPSHGQEWDKRANSPLRVLGIGRLAHYKGFDILLRAIAHTQDTELDLVGHGEQFDHLKSLSRSLGIEDRIRFHGVVSDTERDSLLQACDCLCLPSVDRTESFGIVLLEAMSAGKPCVISKVPGSGMTSVVEAESTGLVVPPEDSGALAAAFGRLTQNRRLLTEMGMRGRQRFEMNLTIEASTRSVIAVYDALDATSETLPQDVS